uniref:RNA helicase n=1 Tax=Panagrellus redivivus TaxID=6233 RepID=A0A7E4ZXY9_PANRE
MDGKKLQTWVNDELHSILGFSETELVICIIGLARSKSPDQLIRSIQELDPKFPNNVTTKAFATQLIGFLNKGKNASASKAPPAPTKAQLRTAELERMNRQLQTLPMGYDDTPAPSSSKPSKSKSSSDKKSSKSLRKRNADSSSEDEVVIPSRTVKPSKFNDDSDGDIDKIEAEDGRDARERDAFAKRLREKDKANTRVVMSKHEAKAAADARKRLKMAEGDEKDLHALAKPLRYESRKQYLEKRKEDKIYELEQQVTIDKQIFDYDELTEKEKLDFDYRQKILENVKKYDQAGNILKQDRYHLPDATKDIPTAYIEEEDIPGGDGRRWEQERMKTATFRAGAKDRIKDDYSDELLLDEQIDFIQTSLMPGADEAPKEPPISAAQKKKMTIDETRKSLPVFAFREEFIQAVKDHQVLIIEGETGSGKTTQLPQYLYEAGFCADKKRIGCTQPRRVAAMSVASRVAEEVGTKLGAVVGYSIRFEDCTSERTAIKYMTDGMLLREFMNEPDLASYSVMMIDEAHERTLHTDILFGLVKDIARFRPDLKLLISSATLDADKFSKFFDNAPIFRIPGRRFPVDIYYTKAPETDYVDAAVISILQIHMTQPLPGDILVFLTGQEEIENIQEALNERIKFLGSRIKELIVLPIYANLPSDMQVKIFEPTPPTARKVVLATNIAETSVTIDGITYVIDPGFVKQNSYDARSGIEQLNVVPIAKAAANQRAGRAGRTGPGKCFRLYTAWCYKHELEDQPTPEIQRTNLGNVVLLLLSIGINDLVHFDFLDPPPKETLIAALEHLYALGALNHKGELTTLGRKMAEFPTDPAMSKMILASDEYGCSEEIITIAAMLSVNASIFYRPKAMAVHADAARKGFWSPVGDHLTLLNVFNRWKETNFSTQWCMESFVQHRTMKRARDIREQLEALLERVEIEAKSTTDTEAIRKAIAAGYFYNLAKLDKGSFKTVKHRHTTQIHPNSSLFEDPPRWVMYYELVMTTKEFMREVIDVDPRWLSKIAPHYYKSNELEDATTKKTARKAGKSAAELQGK